mmetsp:Transcript_15958/g.20859  ORF Transcript_15958/g.20859 Transcript_15958/m.20859 type:complete len:396 (+) Transcript_15958:267-1454(+)|eukprot:CAMPEP_0198150032 /NCGR_PEP_ID=MMETSP1443-20131203/49096_1 /TAXON_ID=186043 /ORGANISM="Entomoneis sp., Strain CCMP2396" /LENGTH=395 /DNA_ID=CAMNT_0043815223 /DNA_START=224 /DNA_END=1411 /DNA_ORIENTATION=+
MAQDLRTLVEEQRWEEVRCHFEAHPEEAAIFADPLKGWTKLHWLSSIGAVPSTLIELVASLYPKAITMPENRYGDTPLHIICRNAQVTRGKPISLLNYMKAYEEEQKLQHHEQNDDQVESDVREVLLPSFSRRSVSGKHDGVLIRNSFGGTALHSACNHNAAFEVIQALVNTNPRLVTMATFDGIPPIHALYTSYIQTIPGYMAVACTLKGEDIGAAGHFDRFWRKLVFLATADFRSGNLPDPSRLVLHGLLHSSHLPVNCYKIPLKREPELAEVQDEEGNLALHLLVSRRPFRLKEREAIEATLEASTAAALVRNNAGDFPLLIAIRNKIPWANGVDLLVHTAPATVQQRDVETNLLPFQFAASVGGPVALDTTYELLSTQPDLLLVDRNQSSS